MDTETMIEPKVHQGRNIRRFRDILGVKQEILALELNMSQQAVSKLEQKETIDDETLNRVAEILKIPVEAIKNMIDETAINIVANTFHDDAAAINHFQCTFNPLDRIVELYERMLKIEQEKISLLQEVLKDKK